MLAVFLPFRARCQPNRNQTFKPFEQKGLEEKKKSKDNKKWFQRTKKNKRKMCECVRLKSRLMGTGGGSPQQHQSLLECVQGSHGCCPPALSLSAWEDEGLEADDAVGRIPSLSLCLMVAWEATLAVTRRRLMNRSCVYCPLYYKHLKWSLMKMCWKNKYSLI